ncbi:glycolipid transfer protein 3 [Carica papaya]|uniref:glycolipid transfer protein 3 n=1 Tax=Carica papaya TaxID=3649 RepID=UPI000B8CE512|nr:glycolipid transfer protein 3 [Carica papaya]
MKRRRYEMEESDVRSAIEELSMFRKMKPDGDFVPAKPFLDVCNLILQILDKIGPTMTVLRQDINQNIQRLEKFCESDPPLFSNLVEILKKERDEGNARQVNSCSRAFVWLTRSMDFTVTLLQSLTKDPGKNMEQAVEESYNITLKPWHGWISAAAFKVALKLVPDNKTFISLLTEKDDNYEIIKEDIETLISLLLPLLEEIHSIMELHGLDKMKST